MRTFNRFLDDIVKGNRRWVPTCTGLDGPTIAALNDLGAQKKKRPVDIAACRVEFARMLDGTHARDQDEQIASMFEAQ
jgi:hypothetical protein